MNSRTPSAPPKEEAAKSAAKRVYLDLRRRIIDMSMLPGTKIVERDIAAEHNTSRTPVHEAVLRLGEEGLVEVVHRVGTFVARIPLDQLEEAMFVRTALETAIIEKAAGQAQPEDIARLKKILADQQACVDAADDRGFHQCDESFHEAIASVAGLPGAWKIIQQTKIQVDRYRRLTLTMPGRMVNVIAQHEAVVKALECGLAQDAATAMREHLDFVLPFANVAKTLRPEFFSNQFPPGHELDMTA